jgi:hypothetical protein
MGDKEGKLEVLCLVVYCLCEWSNLLCTQMLKIDCATNLALPCKCTLGTDFWGIVVRVMQHVGCLVKEFQWMLGVVSMHGN